MFSAGKFSLAFTLAISAAGVAQAQWGYPSYHSSTAAEGFQRGFADVVRSAGEANLNNSQAAINIEQARSMNMQNHLQYAETYFQMRQVNRQARAAEARPRLSSEQLFRIAQEQAPNRLTSSDLDPLTGDITWPIVLEDPTFAPYRETLSRLFAERASSGGAVTVSEMMEIRRTADAALAELRANIRNFPTNDYLRARRFLENLSFSAGAT
jgi:hypothetical protein